MGFVQWVRQTRNQRTYGYKTLIIYSRKYLFVLLVFPDRCGDVRETFVIEERENGKEM